MLYQKGNALIIGILIGLLVAGGLFGAFYFGTQKNNSTQSSSQQSVTSTVQPTSQTTNQTSKTSNIPADWTTYNSSKYGYTLSYPKNFKHSPSPDTGTDTPILGVSVSSADNNMSVTVSIWPDKGLKITDSKSRDQWCDTASQGLAPNMGPGGPDCNSNSNLLKIILNGFDAYKFSGGRDNSIEDIYYLPHGKYVYQLNVWRPIPNNLPNGKINFDAILVDPTLQKTLDTFQFTN